MANRQINEEQIRKPVEKRLRARQAFIIHLTIFIAVNLFLVFLWQFLPGLVGSDPDLAPFVSMPWPLLVFFGWGIGLVAHGMTVYYQSGAADRMRERLVQREIERERARVYGDEALEKPKRGTARLTDDGEIAYDDEDDSPTDEERPRAKTRKG